MGWSIGYDDNWKRDIGWGVPAYCDHPGCETKIDRGLAYVCGGEPYGGDKGCGLFFCPDHMFGVGRSQLCERCSKENPDLFEPKPDHPDWIKHKLTDDSWAKWREENADWVEVNRI